MDNGLLRNVYLTVFASFLRLTWNISSPGPLSLSGAAPIALAFATGGCTGFPSRGVGRGDLAVLMLSVGVRFVWGRVPRFRLGQKSNEIEIECSPDDALNGIGGCRFRFHFDR